MSEDGRLLEIASYPRLLSPALNSFISLVFFSPTSLSLSSLLLSSVDEAGQEVSSNQIMATAPSLCLPITSPYRCSKLGFTPKKVCPRFYFRELQSTWPIIIFHFVASCKEPMIFLLELKSRNARAAVCFTRLLFTCITLRKLCSF